MGLIESLLKDTESGIKTDSDGRRYFRQRHVEFETISIADSELNEKGWLGFEEELTTPDWENFPSHRDLRAYAAGASERYLAFWYRVFDVACARALCGRDTKIFQKDFFLPSTLFDIGIPDDQRLSSVHPALHEKIKKEYNLSYINETDFRIFYLSNYLAGLTADINEILQPYNDLWNLKNERLNLMHEPDLIFKNLTAPLEAPAAGGSAMDKIIEHVERSALASMDRIIADKKEKSLESDSVRNLVHMRRAGALNSLNERQLEEIMQCGDISLHGDIRRLYDAVHLPAFLHRQTRTAASMSGAAFRIELRLSRLRWLRREFGREVKAEALESRLQFYRENFQKKMTSLSEPGMRDSGVMNLLDVLESLRDPSVSADSLKDTALENYFFLKRLEELEKKILDFYNHYTSPIKKEISTDESVENKIDEQTSASDVSMPGETALLKSADRYIGLEKLEIPAEIEIGNPFHEHIVLSLARNLILKRLRPVRMSASYYTLVPGSRHGAMTLNPVMKLWKERPNLETGLPRIASLEINTRQTAECLLRLALAADSSLAERFVKRGAIAGLNRRREDISALSVFLLPGSCYPLREINRADFPEFRGRVIGESRTPSELGVEPQEDAVLTGGWYQKNNHSLYYPVGGDNGMLLRLIWTSGRANGPPAFFFALGQFVHDCLADSLVYYRIGERTFRECVEDYYRIEDRIRKNRDETTGRRRLDNSRPGVRFMFAVNYSRLMMEILTGSVQSQFRHPLTEIWMMRHLGLPILSRADRAVLKNIRSKTRSIIIEYDGHPALRD